MFCGARRIRAPLPMIDKAALLQDSSQLLVSGKLCEEN